MALDGAQGWTVCTAQTYLRLRRWVAPKPSPNSMVPAESARKWDPYLIHLFKGGGVLISSHSSEAPELSGWR